jgi:uncharacterized membrane protein
VPANTEVEVGLEFPHGVVTASPPPWQLAVEAEEERQRQLQPFRDLANLAFGGLAFLILIGGGIGLYSMWYTRGRDLPVGKVAEYLREPPDDLPPAVVGTLIDETADTRDVLATLAWLGNKGALQIIDASTEGFFGIGATRDFRFVRLTTAEPLAPYEQVIMNTIFGRGDETMLSSLKGKLLAQMPVIQQHLYNEVVQRGYFPNNPEYTRRNYRFMGFGLVALAVILGFLAGPTIASFAGWVFLPLGSVVIIGLILALAAQAMPRRTRAGVMATAKWKAFGRYLANVEKYEELGQAREIFARYLPYATVFDLEKSWVRKFAEVSTPAPVWYGPGVFIDDRGYRYRRGPYSSQGYGGGEARDVPVEAAPSGGGFDVQDMSDSFAGSLQDASDSLLDMFDSAGSVFSSPPPSSTGSGGFGGGGGGGWSGGGGGGGGGGGSRGYN